MSTEHSEGIKMKQETKTIWLSAWVLSLCICGSLALAVEPDSNKLDQTVSKALLFLRKTQSGEGCWKSSGFGSERNAGITGLCVMAFLSAGQTPAEGEHARAVADGIRWVLSQQKANGIISTDRDYEMYHHGICTLMLAEVVGMCQPDLADEVRPALARAVEVILKAQRRDAGAHAGGWRYQVYGGDADLSVTGWRLRAAGG